MALSKPTNLMYHLVSAYFERLYTNPVKTKALTSCVIAALGNFVSQKICGTKHINKDSLIAFALFGLFFGGPLPHYFYLYIHSYVKSPLAVLLIERLLYTPCFQALALYILALFERKSHKIAVTQLKRLYLPVLLNNLKYLTLLQYINIQYVPPLFRVLVVNLIGFFWSVNLASKRANM